MFYMYVHPETLPPGGAFFFAEYIWSYVVLLRMRAYMSRRVPNHKQVWELHTSATPPLLLLLSIESTTDLVGHNIFTSIRDRHKNVNFYRTSMATEQVGLQFRNYYCNTQTSDPKTIYLLLEHSKNKITADAVA